MKITIAIFQKVYSMKKPLLEFFKKIYYMKSFKKS